MTGRRHPSHRLVRSIWPASGPLARGSDRLEAATRCGLVLLALILVPVMLMAGSLVHADLTELGARQAGALYRTVATLTEDAAETPAATYGAAAGVSSVAARWRLPDGTWRTGQVVAPDGLTAGETIEIWLDAHGRVATPPVTSLEAGMAGVLVPVFGWLVAVALLALAHLGLRHLLDRRRYRAWSREWAAIGPDWSTPGR